MAARLHLERDQAGEWHCPYCREVMHSFECLDATPYDLVELVCGHCSAVVIMERALWEESAEADLPEEHEHAD